MIQDNLSVYLDGEPTWLSYGSNRLDLDDQPKWLTDWVRQGRSDWHLPLTNLNGHIIQAIARAKDATAGKNVDRITQSADRHKEFFAKVEEWEKSNRPRVIANWTSLAWLCAAVIVRTGALSKLLGTISDKSSVALTLKSGCDRLSELASKLGPLPFWTLAVAPTIVSLFVWLRADTNPTCDATDAVFVYRQLDVINRTGKAEDLGSFRSWLATQNVPARVAQRAERTVPIGDW